MDEDVIIVEGINEAQRVDAHLLAQLSNKLGDGVGLPLLDVAFFAEDSCNTGLS